MQVHYLNIRTDKVRLPPIIGGGGGGVVGGDNQKSDFWVKFRGLNSEGLNKEDEFY